MSTPTLVVGLTPEVVFSIIQATETLIYMAINAGLHALCLGKNTPYYAPASIGSGHYEMMAGVCPSVDPSVSVFACLSLMTVAIIRVYTWTAGNSRNARWVKVKAYSVK